RNRAGGKGNNRSAARHGFDHHETERFRPIDGEKQCRCIGKETLFCCVVNLANQLYLLAIDKRRQLLLEVRLIAPSQFSGNTKRHSGRAGNPNGSFGTFVSTQASEKREVISLFETWLKRIGRQPVVN